MSVLASVALLSVACVGRTGKIGKPIADTYKMQLSAMKPGVTTPQDLQQAFKGSSISLKKSSLENGRAVELWEVFRGGNMDAGAFILWGQIAHDHDQGILFRFEGGRLASYESIVYETPVAK